jgi:hypothetical protein
MSRLNIGSHKRDSRPSSEHRRHEDSRPSSSEHGRHENSRPASSNHRRHEDSRQSSDHRRNENSRMSHRTRTNYRTTPYTQRSSNEHRRQRRPQDDSARPPYQTNILLPTVDQIPTTEIPTTTTEPVLPVSVFDLLNNLSSIDFDGFTQCKGCNPPEILPDKYPGYYDEPCTCTYCPSCSPLEDTSGEYDPVFPNYRGTPCTCTEVDNE